ncbi:MULTISPECIES: beta-N-acetylhexosaminidase [unclassified Marinobacterium]|uniref:beta-N-acetylhexosaminidase n=1 Tax=unclassified Marinobacterium TaxID=2644139 RepID=UPI001569922D|nr:MULTISPECIES: beta-N-acetylhexosaminidase [unclassified Marinobacterium]NRP27544.1 Beta-hexosaminidase [Marinobacterium sp. xm-d-420]NRP47917.1 Beta-hexosaminidase [Marinobacterium sp. xm-d-543]NRQ24156.1 Beta-hexosaminidase [Marinobacterium sp. xm-m-312]
MSSGALMLDIAGTELTPAEVETLKSPQVGGLILFARNYQNPAQLRQLMTSIRQVRPDLLVAVDQEGGRVQRFKEGFTRLPPMRVFSEAWQDNPSKAVAWAHEFGWLMATELRDYDIDISFAPVLDLDYGHSEVIGDRSFGTDSEQVEALAGAFMSGMHEAGMATTGKHFPGHGWVEVDSHLGLPEDQRSFAEIDAQDLQPFAKLIKRGLDAVMPAHIKYTSVCSQPAGFSEFWLQRQLRERLSFDGVIFSDDLSMEGAAETGSYSDRADAALAAGCDMVLVCNAPERAQEVLQHLTNLGHTGSDRIVRMRARPKRPSDSERLARVRTMAKELV